MLGTSKQGIDLDCGIAYGRIASWLDDELQLSRSVEGWLFAADGRTCIVEATPLEGRDLGSVVIARTHVVAQGDAEALAVFENLFTLRFISAGG